MAEYRVKFEVFEGPLDLLLYLIKKEEVDIYAVNLSQLATQFIEYIELMRQLDLEVAGEFVVMASTLMYIKSRELLPVDQQVERAFEDLELDFVFCHGLRRRTRLNGGRILTRNTALAMP